MTKEQLAQWLIELDENVLKVAIMYAENYLKYGVDVTEKWDTATKQQWSLERAERYGYAEGRKTIVRCKDCIHYRYYGLSEETVSECRIDHAENPDGNWYCADGEREDK